MRAWDASTFVFVSANTSHEPNGVEERWIPVMAALIDRGATVRFIGLPHSPTADLARKLGVAVDPYILDRWNVVRSRSRLRKYLQRFVPVAAHSTGLEADLMLRWAARKTPLVRVVHTLAEHTSPTRRRRPIETLMRRFDELGMRSVAAVVVESEEIRNEVREAGLPDANVHLEPAQIAGQIDCHLRIYRDLMAGRGRGE